MGNGQQWKPTSQWTPKSQWKPNLKTDTAATVWGRISSDRGLKTGEGSNTSNSWQAGLGNLASQLGPAALQLFSKGGGNPYLTAASIFGPMIYDQLRGQSDTEELASGWQKELEAMTAQAAEMALPLAQGRRTRQQIEDAQRRSAQVAQASLGRGTGGAAFQRGVVEAAQRTEGELATQQEQQNRMTGLGILQGVRTQELPAIQRYYQQGAAAEAMKRGQLFTDLKALASYDPEVKKMTDALVKLAGEDGLAAFIQKVMDNTSDISEKVELTKYGDPKNPTSMSRLDIEKYIEELIEAWRNNKGQSTTPETSPITGSSEPRPPFKLPYKAPPWTAEQPKVPSHDFSINYGYKPSLPSYRRQD